MKKERFLILMVLISFTLFSYVDLEKTDNFSERAKIALRDAGHKLLVSVGDSTSLILPVIELDDNTFALSFQNELRIEPANLISVLSQSLGNSNLPNSYIVEVIAMSSREVSYSYEMKDAVDSSTLACIGRNLPLANYKIKLHFTGLRPVLVAEKNYSLLALVCIGFIGFVLLYWKYKASKETIPSFSKIGNYQFYQEQNKLVKGNNTIELSAKECELLAIFSEKPNQIIKRNLLIKEVWEDKGVFVGRSLDTFISKIRKKFQDDDSINIVTVHGVGYKLEIS